jgi:hypothetical protein
LLQSRFHRPIFEADFLDHSLGFGDHRSRFWLGLRFRLRVRGRGRNGASGARVGDPDGVFLRLIISSNFNTYDFSFLVFGGFAFRDRTEGRFDGCANYPLAKVRGAFEFAIRHHEPERLVIARVRIKGRWFCWGQRRDKIGCCLPNRYGEDGN